MVFTRLGLGLVAGVTIPLVVSEPIYMTLANSFLRPHLKFQIEKDKLSKDHAIPTEMLDAYIKDIIGSFFLFFLAIGPMIYTTYIKNEK